MLTRILKILNAVALLSLLLAGGGCKPSANSDATSTSEDETSMNGGNTSMHKNLESQTAATDDTQFMTLTNSRDGTKFRVALPAEPTGDFGPPDYSRDLDEDVGLSGYSSGVEAINKLATDASGGADAHDIFLAIMADHGGNRMGADSGYTDSGALLLAVWYQRQHPEMRFADAAEALKQNPPDIRKIKKAAHVAGLWIDAFNTGNYNYGVANRAPPAPTPTTSANNADPNVDPDPAGTQWRIDTDAKYGHTSAADGDAAKVVVGYGIKYRVDPNLPLEKRMGDRAYAAFAKSCRASTSDDDYGESRGYTDTIDRVAQGAAIETILRGSVRDGVPMNYRQAAEKLFEAVSNDADFKQAEDLAKRSVDNRMKADGISNCFDK